MMGRDHKQLFAGAWAHPLRVVSNRREPIFFGLTLAAVGLALAVRLYGINYSLWGDEIASIIFARQPVWRLWSDWMIREPNPPLFYTILHYWMAVFGQSDFAVKLLATLFGVANIIMVALIARQLGGSWLPALVTTLFVGLNPYHILYSQNARAYTLVALTASIACLALVRIFKKYEDASADGVAPRDWALFGLAMLAALYSHTTMVIFFVAMNMMVAIWIATIARRERLLISWILCNFIVCAGYAWWVWITFQQLGDNNNIDWMDTVYAETALHYTVKVFAPHGPYFPTRVAAVVLLPLVFFSLIDRWGAAIMVLCGTALLFFYLGSKLTTIMQERTILWIYPIFAVGLGLAFARIRRKSIAFVLVVLPLTLSGFAYREEFPDREWDRWPDTVALAAQDPTVPVFVTTEAFALFLDHYCNQRFVQCPLRVVVVTSPDEYPWARGLSNREAVTQRQAWSIGSPVLRTIEWDESFTLFPDQHACSATDPSPAYLAGKPLVLGQVKVKTWHRRPECSDK